MPRRNPVSLNQLVGGGVRPQVVHSLHPAVVQGARTHCGGRGVGEGRTEGGMVEGRKEGGRVKENGWIEGRITVF